MRTVTWYSGFAKATSRIAGRPITFAVAVTIIVIWA